MSVTSFIYLSRLIFPTRYNSYKWLLRRLWTSCHIFFFWKRIYECIQQSCCRIKYQLHSKSFREIITKKLYPQRTCLLTYLPTGDTLKMKMKPPVQTIKIHIWYIFGTLIVFIERLMYICFLISWHAYLSFTLLELGFQM